MGSRAKVLGVLNIFGQAWKVVLTKIDPRYAGFCEYDKKKITISDEIQPDSDMFYETYYHEWLHAVFHRCSFKQSGLPHELEEVMIDQIGKIMAENRKMLFRPFK